MSNPTTKVRAAVVGLGWPGMQHLKGYTADPRSEVIAICIYESSEKGRSVPIADLSAATG